jgi:Glucose-6-phosphate dehydrogenase, NAD binding domain
MLVGASAADAEITACMVPFLLLPVMTGTRPDSDGDGVQIAHARPSEKTAPSDVVVVFGITGDLARLMTFRALYRLEERGLLNWPIVGVALDDWTTEQLVDHAHDSIVATGEPVDSDVFRRFAERLAYIAGDFTSDETYPNVGKAIEGTKRPLFYLEVPPSLFGTIVSGVAKCSSKRRWRVTRATSLARTRSTRPGTSSSHCSMRLLRYRSTRPAPGGHHWPTSSCATTAAGTSPGLQRLTPLSTAPAGRAAVQADSPTRRPRRQTRRDSPCAVAFLDPRAAHSRAPSRRRLAAARRSSGSPRTGAHEASGCSR